MFYCQMLLIQFLGGKVTFFTAIVKFSLIVICGSIFRNRPSKICGRQHLKNLKGYGRFKQTIYITSDFFNGCLPQILLCPFLNSLSHTASLCNFSDFALNFLTTLWYSFIKVHIKYANVKYLYRLTAQKSLFVLLTLGLPKGSFHGRSSNGCQVKNFKFLQIFTIDIIQWEEKFLNIWWSNLFSLEIYGISWPSVWNLKLYSVQCSQYLRMFIRNGWLHGKVNCKIFGKSIKK